MSLVRWTAGGAQLIRLDLVLDEVSVVVPHFLLLFLFILFRELKLLELLRFVLLLLIVLLIDFRQDDVTDARLLEVSTGPSPLSPLHSSLHSAFFLFLYSIQELLDIILVFEWVTQHVKVR
jgi:hypothetical protein